MEHRAADYLEIGHIDATFQINIRNKRVVLYGVNAENPNSNRIASVTLSDRGRPVSTRWNGDPVPFSNQKHPDAERSYRSFPLVSDSEDRWAHRCPSCRRKYRSEIFSFFGSVYCPYCGVRSSSADSITFEQYAVVHAFSIAMAEFEEDSKDNDEIISKIFAIDDLVRKAGTHERHGFFPAGTYLQRQFYCDMCGSFNDIEGVYGFCAKCCRRNNLSEFHDQLEVIRVNRESGTVGPEQAVRDAVTHFGGASKDLTGRFIKDSGMADAKSIRELSRWPWHDVTPEIVGHLGVDILRNISREDTSFFRMMMARRHIYEHTSSVIDQKYKDKSGDSSARVGSIMRESDDNVDRFIGLLWTILDTFLSDFETHFPVANQLLEAEKKIRAQYVVVI